MATKQPRVNRNVDAAVRAIVERVKRYLGTEYSEIDDALGKPARWSRNALARSGLLAVEHARLLIGWAQGVAEASGDKEALGNILSVEAALRNHPAGLQPVPLLVLTRDIDHVSREFDRYLELRRRPDAKGLLRDFLSRRDAISKTTYARSSAWAFSNLTHLSGEPDEPAVLISIGKSEITATPDEFQRLVLAVVDFLEKSPRKAARGAR
jgi:hypothetical protein